MSLKNINKTTNQICELWKFFETWSSATFLGKGWWRKIITQGHFVILSCSDVVLVGLESGSRCIQQNSKHGRNCKVGLYCLWVFTPLPIGPKDVLSSPSCAASLPPVLATALTWSNRLNSQFMRTWKPLLKVNRRGSREFCAKFLKKSPKWA